MQSKARGPEPQTAQYGQPLLTPAELQTQLSISRQTYQRLLKRGMPCRLVMSARRFVWAEVLAWLPRGTVSAERKLMTSMFDINAYLKQKAKDWRRR